MHSSFRIILGLLYVVLVATMIVMTVITYRASGESDSRAYQVKHTVEVIELTHEISFLYGELQLLSNVFATDGRVDEEYAKTKDSLNSRLRTIRTLTSDNPMQGVRLDTLEKAIQELIVATDSGMKEQISPARSNFRSGVSLRTQVRMGIHRAIDSIRMDEQRLLRLRETEHAESVSSYHLAFNTLIVGMIVTLFASFLIVRYNFNKRLRIEENQRRSNEVFFELFNASPVAGLLCRASDLVVLNCNQRYIQLFNLSTNEIVGKAPRFLEALTGSQFLQLTTAASRQEQLYDIEVKFERPGTGPIWLEVSLQPVAVEGEACVRFTVQDISTHKKAELDIKAALAREMELNKMKSDFITLGSHEFRTPLTSILSSAAILRGISTQEPDRLGRHVSRIKGAVDVLTSILDDFVSVNRIDEGKIEVTRVRLDIKETVQAVCESVKPFAKNGQLIVYTHIGDRFAQMDKKMLEQITNSLVRNAIKYSPEDTAIEIGTHANHDLWLTVKDQGIGIPVQEQGKLFERFFRASNAADIQGTGLGLYIVRCYVERLNGSIKVNSQEGMGSEFRVTFKDAVW